LQAFFFIFVKGPTMMCIIRYEHSKRKSMLLQHLSVSQADYHFFCVKHHNKPCWFRWFNPMDVLSMLTEHSQGCGYVALSQCW